MDCSDPRDAPRRPAAGGRSPHALTPGGLSLVSCAAPPRFSHVSGEPVLKASSSEPSVLRGHIRDIRHPYGRRAIGGHRAIAHVLLHRPRVPRIGRGMIFPRHSGPPRMVRHAPGHRFWADAFPLPPSQTEVIWGQPSRTPEAVNTARICSTRWARPGYSANDGTRPQSRCARHRGSGPAS
jgi:hypothetical protein